MSVPSQAVQGTADHREVIAEALWRVRVVAEIAERYVDLSDDIGLARTLRHVELYFRAATAAFDACSLEKAQQTYGRGPCEPSPKTD
jgi:hypothetical protein